MTNKPFRDDAYQIQVVDLWDGILGYAPTPDNFVRSPAIS